MVDEGLGAMASRASAPAHVRRSSPLGLALCAATLASACSIALVRPTPRATSSGRHHCTSNAVPALELALVPVFLYFAVGKSIENEDVKQDDATPELLAGAALLAFASSLYGFAAIGQCRGRSRALAMEDDRAASAQEARDEADVARRRREQKAAAWELTERAKAAARAGDCATVKAIDAQVRDLDAALHATVFVSDAAIASCLADPTAPLAPIP